MQQQRVQTSKNGQQEDVEEEVGKKKLDCYIPATQKQKLILAMRTFLVFVGADGGVSKL